LADYIGPHKIMWGIDYPRADGFFPGAPQIRKWLELLSAEARHQVPGDGVLQPELAAACRGRKVAF
jgi:hypothetical protein